MNNDHNWNRDIDRTGLRATRIGGQLIELFKKNLSAPTSSSRTTDSPLSYKTQGSKCRAIINLVIALRELPDSAIKSLWHIETKHIEILCEQWRKTGNTIRAIENKLSHLRSLSKWIGKPKLVPRTDCIIALHGMTRSTSVATEDKSWSGNNVDASAVIGKAFMLDPYVGVQLLLQKTFGLRAQESFLLKPRKGFVAIEEMLWLRVEDGTKAKRPRVSPVLHDYQKAVLNLAMRYANHKSGSTIPVRYSLEQWRSHYYYICKRIGLTKNEIGVTSHGLRHEALQNLYQYASGEQAPIKLVKQIGNTEEYAHRAKDKTEVQRLAEIIVAEAAGHSKVQKAGAYIGSDSKPRAVSASKMHSVTDEMIKAAMLDTRGSKAAAAKKIDISRSYFHNRLNLMLKTEGLLGKNL
jgi:Integrase/Phage integrase, N-terminal/Bacterial regulatory protein, Fis family